MQPSVLTVAPAPVRELRAAVRGEVVGPGDPGYDRARTAFYTGFNRRPAAVVRPADAQDVSRVVSLAREAGVELAVRSGGHSVAGHGVCDGGIVLDLSALRALRPAAYERPGEAAEHEAWADAFARELRQGEPGAYVGFLGDEGEARVREAYPGATWERLAAVKARYDPGNLFRLNHNVPPAGGAA